MPCRVGEAAGFPVEDFDEPRTKHEEERVPGQGGCLGSLMAGG